MSNELVKCAKMINKMDDKMLVLKYGDGAKT